MVSISSADSRLAHALIWTIPDNDQPPGDNRPWTLPSVAEATAAVCWPEHHFGELWAAGQGSHQSFHTATQCPAWWWSKCCPFEECGSSSHSNSRGSSLKMEIKFLKTAYLEKSTHRAKLHWQYNQIANELKNRKPNSSRHGGLDTLAYVPSLWLLAVLNLSKDVSCMVMIASNDIPRNIKRILSVDVFKRDLQREGEDHGLD